MILEIAEFTAAPGKAEAFAEGIERGLAVIRRAEGCLSSRASRSLEDPDIFVLLNEWRALEDHLDTFRNGPLFAEYRSHINGLFVDQPRIKHYQFE
jgi:quinol monooxygenase YgiN